MDKRDEIAAVLTRLSNSIRVYLSYSHKDQFIAQVIYSECLKRDFKVFFDNETIRTGDHIAKAVSDKITEASKHGCVVLLISKNSVSSRYVTREMLLAVSEGAYVLPVIVDDVDLPAEYLDCLASRQFYRLKTPVSRRQIAEIVSLIEKISLKRLRGE